MDTRRVLPTLRTAADAAYGRTRRTVEDRLLELRYGFPRAAAGIVELGEVNQEASGRHGYEPSAWGLLGLALDEAEIDAADVFIDIGCGMGRVLVEAARYPFRRVIGIDVAAEFTSVAAEVLARNRARLRCTEIEIVTADAVSYPIPDDVTVAYLANPLGAELARRVLRNVIASVDRRPRGVRIVYVDPPAGLDLESCSRLAFVRHGRRRLRRSAPAERIRLYEVTVSDAPLADTSVKPA